MAPDLRWGPIWDGDNFAEWVNELRGKSGVYLIRSSSTGELLYIGESHRGKLPKTLTRHFQNWDGPTAGYTYDRHRVEVSVIVCAAADAPDLQYELIAELQPRDNEIGRDGEILPDLEDVPF